MDHQHAVIWIDHKEAQVVKFGVTGSTIQTIRSHSNQPHLHHKANTIGDGRAPLDKKFFDAISLILDGMKSIVITGPSTAKMELAEHFRRSHPAIATAIKGIEPLDHPTTGELLKFGQDYLRAADRLHHA